MASGGAYDVFVSYARSDEAGAVELNGWLCARGLSTFFDRSALRAGLRWIPALEDAIGRSKAIAILVGSHGIGNTQQYERELALVRKSGDKKFPVIPVLMPGCESPPAGFLQLLTWIDLSKGKTVREQTECLEALCAALRGDTLAPSDIRASICPYRGLEPFREEDAAFFCGRDDAIRELATRVQDHSLVAVVGPSGSGKSSLVFAGLVPALRKQGRATMWDVVTLRPGESPLRALAAAFGTTQDDAGPAAIDTYLEAEAAAYRTGDAHKLRRVVNDRLDDARERPDRLLIYVDQWEELYAMVPAADDEERLKQHSADVDKFIELLIAASSGARSRASVVLTVRADFYNQLIRAAPIDALLPKQQVNIPAMRREDVRSAIETPAKKAGLSFDPPKLVDRILDDVGLEEGRLPLLQFALKETWQEREGDKLTAKAYTTVGGVTGAIEKTAQDAYERLSPAQKDAARRLFLGLVMPGEGQVDTRARGVVPEDSQQRQIINLFADPKTRLLVTGYETLQGEARRGSEPRSTVEIAHEALIQRWRTLRDWVGANRQKLRDRTVILRAKAEWEEHSQNEKFLLDPGVQLERGRALLDDPGDVRVDDIRDFIVFSIEREQRRLDVTRDADLAHQRRIAEAERQAREAAEEAARQAKARLAAEEKMRAETQLLLDRANQAIAESISNDLGLMPEKTLTPRQRNALWKLAVADEPVKSDFVIALARSPEDTLRGAPGFAQVFRALGLLRPSSIEAEKLFDAATAAFQTTISRENAESLAAEFEALAAKLTAVQAQRALDTVLEQIGGRDDLGTLGALATAIRTLAAKLSDAQVQEAFDSVLLQTGGATNVFALRALAQVLQAFPTPPVKITVVQAQQALDPVLQQIGQTTDLAKLTALAEALQALAAKLTEAQAQQALDPVLQLIGQRTDLTTLRALAQALEALAGKLTAAQAQKALEQVLERIGKTSDLASLQALAKALRALAAKLTEPQAQQQLDSVLLQIGRTANPFALRALGHALEAFPAPPAKITDAQAEQALDLALRQVGRTTKPFELQALALVLEALAAKLSKAQTQRALGPVLRQIGQRTNPFALQALAKTLEALAAKLSEGQVLEAFDAALVQIGRTTNPSALQTLSEAVQALAMKLTESQVQQGLYPLLQQIGSTTHLAALQALAKAVQTLSCKFTEAQAQEAFAKILGQIGTSDLATLQALAKALQALAAKLTEAQAQQALDPILQYIGQTTDLVTHQALAEAFQALTTNSTEAQAQQALDQVLQQIGQTTNSSALQALARGLGALGTKLTDAQALQSLLVAVSSLAWAASDEEAAAWARTLVTLLPRTINRDATTELIAAIVFPTAAGPATEILLEAIRARHHDAPTKEAGMQASLSWLASKFPEVLRPPVCPAPPQPTAMSGLRCPFVGIEAQRELRG
jgi:hypothetical protein